MPDGQKDTAKAKIERIVKGEKSEWKKEYDKDDITVHSDPIFGRVKLTTPKGSVIGREMAAVGGIVAFSDYYEGGIGGLKAYHPYVPREVMDMLRGK